MQPRIPTFAFDHPLAELVVGLERERDALNHGTADATTRLELHNLFQLLTSILSARIEGNRTSLLDAVSATNDVAVRDDGVKEIANILAAVDLIDEHLKDRPLSHIGVREIHKTVTSGLHKEGDKTPGAYRRKSVSITGTDHQPPLETDVLGHMDALLDFANQELPSHLQLLQAAVIHHRLLWIHPFGNGNGRVARLVSYWMLVRMGFSSPGAARTVNPTAVFGADRFGYYNALAKADSGENEGLINWCLFLLTGLQADLDKTRQFTDAEWVRETLLSPAIRRMREAGRLTERQAAALEIAATKQHVKAADMQSAFPGSPQQRSNEIRTLVQRGLLQPIEPGRRVYRLGFARGELTIHVIAQLDQLGMLPEMLRDDAV